MAYTGNIKFILETNEGAIVEETPAGATSFDRHVRVNADFSLKERGDSITYAYDDPDSFNDGRDITIS